jgi:hypothetical protein
VRAFVRIRASGNMICMARALTIGDNYLVLGRGFVFVIFLLYREFS